MTEKNNNLYDIINYIRTYFYSVSAKSWRTFKHLLLYIESIHFNQATKPLSNETDVYSFLFSLIVLPIIAISENNNKFKLWKERIRVAYKLVYVPLLKVWEEVDITWTSAEWWPSCRAEINQSKTEKVFFKPTFIQFMYCISN